MVKEVYNPKAVIPHAASLHQACAHCAIFPTAASRRSLGRISVPVWPDTLSGRLPVVALVGHHPTNKLIGRGPIPHRKSFPPQTMHPMVLSGIRPSFPGLSQSAGQITHVLLTRSPLESLRRALSVRLACVKHAASVRPEPESNSPNKNPSNQQRQNSNQKNLKPNKDTKNWHQKTSTPKREKEVNKNNNKQKPPNTLLSSQTTHPLGRATSPRQKPRTRRADDQDPTEVGLPSGSRRALRARPVSQRRVNKLREGKLGVKWADRACLSARHLSCAPGVRRLR